MVLVTRLRAPIQADVSLFDMICPTDCFINMHSKFFFYCRDFQYQVTCNFKVWTRQPERNSIWNPIIGTLFLLHLGSAYLLLATQIYFLGLYSSDLDLYLMGRGISHCEACCRRCTFFLERNSSDQLLFLSLSNR